MNYLCDILALLNTATLLNIQIRSKLLSITDLNLPEKVADYLRSFRNLSTPLAVSLKMWPKMRPLTDVERERLWFENEVGEWDGGGWFKKGRDVARSHQHEPLVRVHPRLVVVTCLGKNVWPRRPVKINK